LPRSFLLLLQSLIVFPGNRGQSNPCQDMTIGDCTIGDDNIIARYPFPASICHDQCKKADTCSFWRTFQNETMEAPECLLLRTNYHQDCKTFGGPTIGSIQDCMDVDLSTCWALIGEECTYVGNRLTELEPPPKEVSSILECQEWAQLLPPSSKASHFVFVSPLEECRIYSSPKTSCSAIGGPATTPPVEECKEWVVIQKRGQYGNPKDYFSLKLWTDYKEGFGDPDGELWLGLEPVSQLTSEGTWELRVDLEDFQGSSYTAVYNTFKVEPEADGYRLRIGVMDQNNSNVMDSLRHHNGMMFSTRDKDQDNYDENCAEIFMGAWWYGSCHDSNLNGYNYNRGDLPHEYYGKGIIWQNENNVPEQGDYFSWPIVEMKIRRTI